MRSIFAAVLSLAASTLAYSVTAPSSGQGWTLGQSNSVAWERVSTDRLNFTILLINQNTTPQLQQVLGPLVDASGSTSGTTTIALPSTVIAGENYQVNFVQDSQHVDTILAQSGKFSIEKSTTSTASATLTRSSGTSAQTTPASNPSSVSPSDSSVSDALNPVDSSVPGAGSRLMVNGCVMALVILVGALLA